MNNDVQPKKACAVNIDKDCPFQATLTRIETKLESIDNRLFRDNGEPCMQSKVRDLASRINSIETSKKSVMTTVKDIGVLIVAGVALYKMGVK